MCNNCYHKFGRRPEPVKCEHKEKRSYAKGLCQNCYINQYNAKKKFLKQKQIAEQSQPNEAFNLISMSFDKNQVPERAVVAQDDQPQN